MNAWLLAALVLFPCGLGPCVWVACRGPAAQRLAGANLATVLTTVLFRYLPQRGEPDVVNAALRRLLLARGQAVVGRTDLGDGLVRLKLTLLNPDSTRADVDHLLALVLAAGAEEDQEPSS